MLTIEMAQARADLNKLENDFNRNQELFNRNLISKEEFQTVRFQYDAQKAAFEKARLNLAYTIIRAPISGVIATRYIKVGNMVNTNQQLFKIVDFDPLIARLYIPEVDVDKVRVGLNAETDFGCDQRNGVRRLGDSYQPDRGFADRDGKSDGCRHGQREFSEAGHVRPHPGFVRYPQK